MHATHHHGIHSPAPLPSLLIMMPPRRLHSLFSSSLRRRRQHDIAFDPISSTWAFNKVCAAPQHHTPCTHNPSPPDGI